LLKLGFSLAVFSGLSLVVGCTEMTDFYPNAQTVEIEGHVFFVNPNPHLGKNVYLAGLNDGYDTKFAKSVGRGLPALNVAAIEKVTGCRVIRETIDNVTAGDIRLNSTRAAVEC